MTIYAHSISLVYKITCLQCRKNVNAIETTYYASWNCVAGCNSEWDRANYHFCSENCVQSFGRRFKGCPTKIGRCQTCSGSGKVKCTICSGLGKVKTSSPCEDHTISGKHYYCISNIQHGNNVNEYHK